MPTRRAFLIAGSTFLTGAGLGSACGCVFGSRPAEAKLDAEPTPPSQAHDSEQHPTLPPPSGDAELDKLRRLALRAPIEELSEKWLMFLDLTATAYPNDTYLPTGVDRLIRATLDTVDLSNRATIARVLEQLLTRSGNTAIQSLRNHLPELRKVR